MSKTDLLSLAGTLPVAWKSTIVGQAAGVNLKVLRMDGRGYANESHSFAEALLVLDGKMKLQFDATVIEVHAGEVYLVPAGVPHAVAAGSHGTLVIIDRPEA
jgi:quercetin dioxygenase-like cupin family protein